MPRRLLHTAFSFDQFFERFGHPGEFFMSLSSMIAPQLPYLRRFARTVTGSQTGGDAYAVATLEALVQQGDLVEPGAEAGAVRQALFKLFLKIWSSVPINRAEAASTEGALVGAADRSLDAITPMPRVVFLLRTVEGFDDAAIADMLDKPVAEVEALIDTAGREIAVQLTTNVLIIEDEPIIAMDLETIVHDLGHHVTDVARTHKEAVQAITERSPGLVLADIHLADGSSGLDAVNEILTRCDVPVIFITAYPERLLTGERPEPTFLITKPFRTETVRAIISQALFFDRRASLAIQSAAD
jgi:CheY-like chemotaxis protein/DNA-directed RNA polymerase specialized sigma24 family protein